MQTEVPMNRDKIKNYIKSLLILFLRVIRWMLFSIFWVLGFGIAIAAISEFGWIIGGIPGVIVAAVCIFIGFMIAIALEKLIKRINSRNDKKVNLNTEKISISKLEEIKVECESGHNELEECEQQENANIGVIWANHYRERNDYKNLAELCKLGDIVAMYDMAQFFYNLCNEEEQQLIKNYEMNPCDTTENKLREAMNYEKWEKFEPENNRIGYYMMWLVRAAMYGNEKAIKHIENCGCYKRKASIPYDFYLGVCSTVNFRGSNFLCDGGFSDIPPGENDCYLERYGNEYQFSYLSYYDSADSDGYGAESEYSSIWYDEFFMKKQNGNPKENERIREEYWEKQIDRDVRKYKIRLKCR